MSYLIFSGIFIGGLLVGFVIRGADDHHEECDKRYETMRVKLCAEIDAREAEIQRLVQGQP